MIAPISFSVPLGVLFDLDATLYINDEALEQQGLAAFRAIESSHELALLMKTLADAAVLEPAQMYALLRAIPENSMSKPVREIGHNIITNWLAPMQLVSDALPLLTRLKEKNIPFGIVTNAPQVQWLKITRLGLHTSARCIYVSEQFGADKPDPSIFIAAANSLGLLPQNILMVGDSLEADVMGSCNVGMQAAWVCRPGIPTPLPPLPAGAAPIKVLTELLPLFA
jgi:HAD superfamily hydrolase (TIGR01509 family)